MKISTIRTGIVSLPAHEPLADAAVNANGKRPIVWVRIGTDSGAEGIGVSYFGGALTGTLRHAIDEMGALLVGDDPLLTEDRAIVDADGPVRPVQDGTEVGAGAGRGRDPAPASRSVRRRAEARGVFQIVDQRFLALGRQQLEIVQAFVDVGFPHLARQFVQQFYTVTVGVVDIDAVGHAMIDAHVEFDAERLQMFQLLQPGVAVRHGERDVVDRLGAD
jgi:hypothetical protein